MSELWTGSLHFCCRFDVRFVAIFLGVIDLLCYDDVAENDPPARLFN